MAEMMRNVTRAIIAIAVIIVVAALVFGFFRQILPMFREEALGFETQQTSESNFDILIDNIEKCRGFLDSDCLCEGFINFPGTFAKNSQVLIEELSDKKTRINWSYNKKSYKSSTIEDLKISAIFVDTKRETSYLSEKIINFANEPPSFEQEGLTRRMPIRRYYPRIMSSKLYKKDDGIYFIIDFGKTLKEPAVKECKL